MTRVWREFVLQTHFLTVTAQLHPVYFAIAHDPLLKHPFHVM